MRTYHAVDVAKSFLELAKDDATAAKDLTNMKLQKLCFCAQLVSVCSGDATPLVSDPFYAWDYGPVEPKLFRLIKTFGRTYFSLNMPAVEEAFSNVEKIADSEAAQLIADTWGKFKTWTAVQMSELTHRRNSPWSVVYASDRYGVIPVQTMKDHLWGDPQ